MSRGFDAGVLANSVGVHELTRRGLIELAAGLDAAQVEQGLVSGDVYPGRPTPVGVSKGYPGRVAR